MSYYSSMYNYQHPMSTMYSGYSGYHTPYMYSGIYPTQQQYYYGTPGYNYYPNSSPYNRYYGYRSPGLFRNMFNRLRYGSSYYYPETGYYGGAAGAGRWPYERDFSSTKNVWKRSGVY